MITFEEIQTTNSVVVLICDKCGKKVDYVISCNGCKKDLCLNCHPEINYWEYPFSEESYEYCDSCWEKGERYRDKIGRLESDIIVAQDKWNEDCKK